MASDIDWKTTKAKVKRKPEKRSKEDLAESLLDAFEEMKAAQDRGVRAMVVAQLVAGVLASPDSISPDNVGRVMLLVRRFADEVFRGAGGQVDGRL